MIDYSNVKLGKLPAKKDPRSLKLSNYKVSSLPIPTGYSNLLKRTDITPMLNNQIGDCTVVGIANFIANITSMNGNQIIIPDEEILKFYEVVSGYNPNIPNTDRGAVLVNVLNHWRTNPFYNQSLSAFVEINPKNIREYRESIYYFGGCYLGFELPLSCQNMGTQWKYPGNLEGINTPGSWGGHCVELSAYDSNTNSFTTISWGEIVTIDMEFLLNYCDEGFALLTPDLFNNGKSINGFNINQLQNDLNLLND